MRTQLSTSNAYDVVTIGETMIRFSPIDRTRLEQSELLQAHVGGSESNTAVGLARLGKRVAWLSRLTNNPLGRRIASSLAAQGVCTQHVQWTDDARIGTYYFEQGAAPRASQVVYDRANSAFSLFDKCMLPRELFAPGRAQWLHITGISMALSDDVRATILEAVALARTAGWQVSFDLNYRKLLWSYEQALAMCMPLIRDSDLLFLPKRDAIGLWKLDGEITDDATLDHVVEQRAGKTTIITLSERGSMAGSQGQTVFEAVQPVDPIGRLGLGDAFSAGFLDRWLESPDIAQALRWGNAMAQLKCSIPGDFPIVTRAEVEAVTQSNSRSSIHR